MLALLFAAQVIASQASPVTAVDLRGDRARQPYQSLYARGNRANLPVFPAGVPRTVVSLPARMDRATAYTYAFPDRGVRASPPPVVTVPTQAFPLLLNPSVVVARPPARAWSTPGAAGGSVKAPPSFAQCAGFLNSNAFGTINVQRRVDATGYQNVNRFGTPSTLDREFIIATGYHNTSHFGAALITQTIPSRNLVASGWENINRFGSVAVTLAPYYLYLTGLKEALEIGDPLSGPSDWFARGVETVARTSLRIRGTPPFDPAAIVAEESAAGILAADMTLVAIATEDDGTAVLTFYDGGPWTDATTPVIDTTKET